jgi:RNA polymerase sigma factor (TIGR02999 family)
MSDVTRLLDAVASGDCKAAAELLPLVYDELRKLAASRLAPEAPGQTLQPTALVHEAYLRLIGPADERRWANRGHFFASAAEAMRRILVEIARRKGRVKHGGGRKRLELDEASLAADPASDHFVAIDEALGRLEARDPGRAAVVKLRYFAGLTTAEAAQVLGISRATAERHWAFARAWLYADLTGGEDPG